MSGAITVAVDGWAATSLDITVLGWNDTYVPTVDTMTMIEYAGGLDDWLDSSSRPWFGPVTFEVSPMTTLVPWTGLRCASSHSTAYVPNAALRTLLDWPASRQTATDIYTQTGVRSTAVMEVGLGDWLPRVEGAGPVSRDGAYLPDSQAYALRPARVELIGDEAAMAALGVALSEAADPIWFYAARSGDLSREGDWVQLLPGEIPRPSRNEEVYRLDFGVYG